MLSVEYACMMYVVCMYVVCCVLAPQPQPQGPGISRGVGGRERGRGGERQKTLILSFPAVLLKSPDRIKLQ